MNLGIPDCHLFFRIECTSEILSDGARTRLGPVSQSVNRLKCEFFWAEILRVRSSTFGSFVVVSTKWYKYKYVHVD